MGQRIKIQVREKYLSGILNVPEHADACVVLASGFLISMDGPGGVFRSLAKKLNGMGYAVLRFSYKDKMGHAVREPLLEKNLEELQAAVDFAKKSFKKVYILGYSLSGMLTLLLARTMQQVEKIVLWAPFLGLQVPRKKYDLRRLQMIRRQHDLGYWAMLKLMVYYLLQRGKVNMQAVVRPLDVPILVVHGDRDEICDFSQVRTIFQGEKMKVTLLKNADHFFTGYGREIVDMTAAWLHDGHENERVHILPNSGGSKATIRI